MGKLIMYSGQALASLIIGGAILYGIFKLGQVIYKGIKADFNKEK